MSNIDKIREELEQAKASTAEELEAFRMRFISKKSVIGELFGQMKDIAAEDRKAYGQQINDLKNLAQSRFKELIASLENNNGQESSAPIDLTLPSPKGIPGSSHPITITKNRIHIVAGGG